MEKSTVCIPKIIHQTYKSFESLPLHWQTSPASWRQHHPEWKYMFWGDSDLRAFVSTHFSWFLVTYDSLPYTIQRIDVIRYMWMYHFGGIYSDCDHRPLKALDSLFSKTNADVFLVRSPNRRIFTNSLMASKPGASFWIDCLREIQIRHHSKQWKWWKQEKHAQVMYTTGPKLIDDIVQRQTASSIAILPSELLMPSACNMCATKPCRTAGSWMETLEGNSWTSPVGKGVVKLYCCDAKPNGSNLRGYVILIVLVILCVILLHSLLRHRMHY